MNFINYPNINNKNLYKFLVFTTFSLLPISFILGNSAININIILADLLLILYSIKFNDWKWTKDNFFKLLIIIQFYLVISSIYSIFFTTNYDFFNTHHKHLINDGIIHDGIIYDGLFRSLNFLKYILLVFSFSLINKFKIELNNLIKAWSIVVFIILFDVFFEKIFGNNILGNVSPDQTRIISFFGEEMIVGSYLLLFGFIISSYWIDKKNIKHSYKIFFNILIILIPFAIFISGEKSNFIKSIIILFVLFIFIQKDKLVIQKKKLIFILILALVSLFYFNDYTRIKYSEILKRTRILNENKNINLRLLDFTFVTYFYHYDVAWKIFKDNPVLGVGSKNFRWQCHKPEYFNSKKKLSAARCSTHPHQVHFELLSEQGAIGYMLIMGILLNFFIKVTINSYKKNNTLRSSTSLYFIIFLIPLLPGGGIFSTYSGSSFWLAVALLNYLNNSKKARFYDKINKRLK